MPIQTPFGSIDIVLDTKSLRKEFDVRTNLGFAKELDSVVSPRVKRLIKKSAMNARKRTIAKAIEAIKNDPRTRSIQRKGDAFGYLGFDAGESPVGVYLKFLRSQPKLNLGELDERRGFAKFRLFLRKKLTFTSRISLSYPNEFDLIRDPNLFLDWADKLPWPLALEEGVPFGGGELEFFASASILKKLGEKMPRSSRSQKGIQLFTSLLDISGGPGPYDMEIGNYHTKYMKVMEREFVKELRKETR